MKYKICLINIYFGKLPNYFELWLNSCRYNETIDFIIFTDDRTKYNYPNNVKVIYTTFENIKMQIQKYFEFKISLEYPYKLCDYKPTYGYVFQGYLKSYDFWGHCDLDVIFGNLRKYLDDDILEKYDKIYTNGHFTIYKNEERINNNFKELLDNTNKEPMYKKVYSDNSSYYFDEWTGIIKLYDGNKYKMYKNKNVIADISIKYNNFIRDICKENGNYIFNWLIEDKKSKLLAIYMDKKSNSLKSQELMYIHLQKRNMTMNVHNKNNFFIVPNKFIDASEKATKQNFKKYNYRFTMYRKEYIFLKLRNITRRILRKGKKE